MKRHVLAGGAWIDEDRSWLSQDDADAILGDLIAQESWGQYPIKVFGKDVMQPRLITWAGDLPYRYSSQTLAPRGYSPLVADLTRRVSEAVGVGFNHVLLNRYRNGKDHMGYHADDERELGLNPVIAALSLGVTRRFVLHQKKNRRKQRRYRLVHGSLLVMGGTIQHTWRHAVPKMSAVQGERINLTFRYLLGPPGCRSGSSRTDKARAESSENTPSTPSA